MRHVLRTVTPAILTSDLTVREHWGMIRAVGFPIWYAFVPGWVVGIHMDRREGTV